MKNSKDKIGYQSLIQKSLTLAIASVVIVFTGCVSQKKYNMVLDEIARLTVDSTFQSYNKTNVVYQKQDEIYNQSKEIVVNSYEIDSLNALLTKQEAELEQTKQTLNKLKNNEK